MDLNFPDLKKEAAATGEDIFNQAANAAKQTSHDLLGDFGNVRSSDGSGAQDDNAHTEHYFSNEQKKITDFGDLDPQAFVQRMSAGAKEAQEQLDAKFAQKTDEFDDFFTTTGKGIQQSAKQGLSDLTSDFMNAERGLFGGGFGGTGDAQPNKPAFSLTGTAAQVAESTGSAVEDLIGIGKSIADKADAFKPSAPEPPAPPAKANIKFYDDEPFATPTAAAKANQNSGSSKDSDTDSPSVSYTSSPAKKAPTDALKEQDNEKFISSEDLLSDFKDDRTATPDSQKAFFTAPAVAAASKITSVPTTDLDDEEDYNLKPLPPVVAPAATAPKLAAFVSEPEPVFKPKPAAPAAAPAVPKPTVVAASKPASTVQQPNIVSVEEIFYKYGLDAWFKPERLHPQVESLIYWRDVKKSGIVFGAGLITLLAISCFSVISVFAYLSILILVGTVSFRIYKSVTQAIQKTNDGHPFQEYLDIDLALSQEKVQNFAGVAVAHVNGFTAELRRLFLVDDIIDSIKFGVILWVFTYIGAWFNGMTLVILAFVSLFTLPKVYENNKQSIDTYLDLVRSKLTEIIEKIKVALPIGNKKPIAAETDKDK